MREEDFEAIRKRVLWKKMIILVSLKRQWDLSEFW